MLTTQDNGSGKPMGGTSDEATQIVQRSEEPPVFLQVHDLKVCFLSEGRTVNAINGITFDVKEGEIVAIVGESGSGKSTTMLATMNLLPRPPAHVTAKQLVFDGTDLLGLSERAMRRIRGRQMAMVFQDAMTALNPVLKIGYQISESLVVHLGMNRREARSRALELLRMVGIPDAEKRLDNYPHQFSGGMRQRAMIAMALACEPSLLVADEPTTALDVTIQAQILELVKALRKELRMAMVWITHDLGVVAGLADRVNVMYAGYIVETGQVDDVYESPRHPYTEALLAAIPNLTSDPETKLRPVKGSPPDLSELPVGCPFADRCPYVQNICLKKNPALQEHSPGHLAACWVDISSGETYGTTA